MNLGLGVLWWQNKKKKKKGGRVSTMWVNHICYRCNSTIIADSVDAGDCARTVLGWIQMLGLHVWAQSFFYWQVAKWMENIVGDTRTSSGLIHVQKNEPQWLNEAARSPSCQHSSVGGALSVWVFDLTHNSAEHWLVEGHAHLCSSEIVHLVWFHTGCW